MAYTVVMTKESVSQVNDVIYSISVRTVVNDGATMSATPLGSDLGATMSATPLGSDLGMQMTE